MIAVTKNVKYVSENNLNDNKNDDVKGIFIVQSESSDKRTFKMAYKTNEINLFENRTSEIGNLFFGNPLMYAMNFKNASRCS
jgi:hypothetical protein